MVEGCRPSKDMGLGSISHWAPSFGTWWEGKISSGVAGRAHPGGAALGRQSWSSLHSTPKVSMEQRHLGTNHGGSGADSNSPPCCRLGKRRMNPDYIGDPQQRLLEVKLVCRLFQHFVFPTHFWWISFATSPQELTPHLPPKPFPPPRSSLTFFFFCCQNEKRLHLGQCQKEWIYPQKPKGGSGHCQPSLKAQHGLGRRSRRRKKV